MVYLNNTVLGRAHPVYSRISPCHAATFARRESGSRSKRRGKEWYVVGTIHAAHIPLAIYLCDKGKQFFSQGNFEAAANAFTSALELNPIDVNSLSNRAACYLKLGSFEQCIQDCDHAFSALDIEEARHANSRQVLDDELEQRQQRHGAMKKKLFARRGAAWLQYGQRLKGTCPSLRSNSSV